MAAETLRVGIVGLGGNTRQRHVPGLLACDNVKITAVCNRRPESTAAAAREFDIPRTHRRWEELVADPEVDAVVIGTWPYLHCPITLGALEHVKHVLCEARMAMNADEARQMFAASQEHPDRVCQLVPSPFGLRVDRVVKEMLDDGFLGQLREAVVIATNDSLADEAAPLHWRQVAQLSGVNMLALGIIHETLLRWTAAPVRVFAQAQAFTPERLDPSANVHRRVGTPDSVHVLATLADGASVVYHASGVTRFGPGMQIHLYGSEGTIRVEFTPTERVLAARRGEAALREVPIPDDKAGGWRVEADFVDSIRSGRPVEFTDFTTGVEYMEFTEAVARSAAQRVPIEVVPV